MNDYRLVLRQWLDERKARNARFSLRAFSQKIGISHSTLSQIFKGERNLSVQTAQRITNQLKLSADEKELFILKVRLESANPAERKELEAKVLEIERFRSAPALSAESTGVLANWLSFAVFSICQMNWPGTTAAEMSKMLEIPLPQVQEALENLIAKGLLRSDGKGYVIVERQLFNPESIMEILRLHGEILRHHTKAFSRDNPERFISWTETIPFASEQMKEAEEITIEYIRRMTGLVEKARQAGMKTGELFILSVAFSNLLPDRWKP
jgi:uncharacterized protein (TIGR02147 family)